MRHILLASLALLGTWGCSNSAFEPVSGHGTLPSAASRNENSNGITGSASGSGHTEYDFGFPLPTGLSLRNFTFNAIALQDGSVIGEWQIVVGSSIIHGYIDCLVIAPGGASARISGAVTSALFTSFQAGTAFAMELFDNGNGASGAADVTTQLLAFRNADPAVGREFCENGTIPTGANLQPLPITHGNFSIRE